MEIGKHIQQLSSFIVEEIWNKSNEDTTKKVSYYIYGLINDLNYSIVLENISLPFIGQIKNINENR
jgi:hypothetical protein